MIVTDEPRRPQISGQKSAAGWTSLHSWIFLVIVALGLLVVVVQNRYHYLSPVGLGKAYRIDKLFGGIQEFEPNQGWIKADLRPMQQPQSLSMADPNSQAMPMHMPGMQPGVAAPGAYSPEPSMNMPKIKKEDITQSKEARVPNSSVQQPKAKEAPELSAEEKLSEFKTVFPNFGKDEFMLANDDLYPDWKKTSPNGSWKDFLKAYGQFIKWWNGSGSPPEPGFKLWKDFMASENKR